MRKTVWFLLTLFAAANVGTEALGQRFEAIGSPAGAIAFQSTGLSRDGSVIVGYAIYDFDSVEAFRWTSTGGYAGLGDLPGGWFYSGAEGVSGDGNTVVGYGTNNHSSNTRREPFRWTQQGGIQGMGYLSQPVNEASATAISTDGSTIVGYDSTGWIWRGGTFRRLVQSAMNVAGGPIAPIPYGVSANGSVVVGKGPQGAFRWTEAGGLTTLGPNSTAYGVSADGTTVVGVIGSTSGGQAFRWTQATGMVGLGFLPGTLSSWATDVSGDGSIVIGVSWSPGPYFAFIWMERWGHMVSLRQYLSDSLGLALPGWPLFWALDITDEGNMITGSGEEIWLAVLRPTVTLTDPVSSDRWIASTQDTIRWRKSGVDTVNIFLSVDFDSSGGTFDTLVVNYPADSLYYAWDIPDSILSKKCALRIVSTSDSTVTDTSEVFRIKGYVLTRDSSDQYEPFRFGRDRWSFRNDSVSMWPYNWWSQFDYDSTDPFTGVQYGFHIPFRLPFSLADSSDFPDWPLFVTTFGVDQCYWNAQLGIYRPSALRKWSALKAKWNGSCFGFTISSLLAFDDSAGFRSRYAGVPPYTDLFSVVLDTAVRKVVNELMIHQFGNPHKQFITSIWSTKTPTQTIHELKELLLSDSPDPRPLLFYNNGSGGGGHAVTPYGVVYDTSTQQYRINVYDNSYPGNPNAAVWVDTTAFGGGDWGNPLWPGWGGNRKLIIGDPVSTYLTRPTMSLLNDAVVAGGQPITELFPSLTADILIRNPGGEITGYADSTVYDGIAGATPFIPATGSKTPPYSYLLPSGSYSILIDNFTDPEAQLSVFTDSVIFASRRQDASSGQTDRFTFDGSFSLRNPDPQQKVYSLTTTIIQDTTAEKAYTLLNCPFSQNDSLHFSILNDDNFRIVNWGTAKSYGLSIEYASRTSNPHFYAPLVSLTANTSHRIVPNWADLQQPVRIYVDVGNNGTIDDTLFINNTVTVEDQGSLFTPKEYNLAQNYPNPFNPYTNIRYALPRESHVRLTIYNILGQEVITLVNEEQEAGHHAVRWEGTNARGVRVSSGVYLYRMEARSTTNNASYISTKKLMFLK